MPEAAGTIQHVVSPAAAAHRDLSSSFLVRGTVLAEKRAVTYCRGFLPTSKRAGRYYRAHNAFILSAEDHGPKLLGHAILRAIAAGVPSGYDDDSDCRAPVSGEVDVHDYRLSQLPNRIRLRDASIGGRSLSQPDAYDLWKLSAVRLQTRIPGDEAGHRSARILALFHDLSHHDI